MGCFKLEHIEKAYRLEKSFSTGNSGLEGVPEHDFLYVKDNHLGNVLTVITDKKTPLSSNGTTVDNYQVHIVNVSDYSPFGVTLDGRTMGDSTYRYGFQGQEKDDEIKGAGNAINYKYRMHDPRVGRFFAIDPLTAEYPQWGPYNFSGNIVIHAVELEGLEPIYMSGTSQDSRSEKWEEIFDKAFKPKEKDGKIILENSGQAFYHYNQGNGEVATLSWGTQNIIVNSEDMNYYRERIRSGKTSNPAEGSGLPIDVRDESHKTYHVGRTPFSYETTCEDGTCTTTYTFSGDGFWDVFEWGDDDGGPSGELWGSTTYPYEEFTFTETYPNPGYEVDENGIPKANPDLVEEGEGPPNASE